MVEIREENSGSDEPSSTTTGGGQQQQVRRSSPMDFIKSNPNDVLCFVLRLATIYFSLNYVLPISSPPVQKLAYNKAFAAAAATNAFRLHQRLRGNNVPVFSQQFIAQLVIEDSAHYLFYCLILVISSPITIALLPITLYAIYHSMLFIIKLGNETGHGNSALVLKLAGLKTHHAPSILSMIACAEIFIFPIIVAMIFTGKTTLFTPFVYYRFLTLRYASRRNPFTRETFAQLKILCYNVANHQSCPNFVRSLIFKSVAFIERIAPQTAN